MENDSLPETPQPPVVDKPPAPSVEPTASSEPVTATSELPTTAPKKPKDFTPPKKRVKKKHLAIILLLVIVIATAFWWFVFNKSSKKVLSPGGSTTQKSTQSNANTPATVAYAFKDKDTSPFTIYWRPANGGTRTDVKKLNAGDTIIASDTSGQNVAFATTNTIYISTDGGKSYPSSYVGSDGAQITSLKFSTDGSRVVFGYLPPLGTKNVVKSIDLSGKNSKDLFTSTKAGVFVIGYSVAKQKIIYQEGCYNCEGAAALPVMRDLTTGKVTDLLSGPTINELGEVAVNEDFTNVLYAQSTENTSASAQGLGIGVVTAAPYTISLLNLASNKTTQVATFGTKNEKDPNGTLKTRQVHVSFIHGSKSAYYSDDAQLYTFSYSSTPVPSLLYTATKPLLNIEFVGGSQDNAAIHTVISGNGEQTSDYNLVNYDTLAKKSQTIFSGDNNTVIFGVSTN